VSKPSTGQWVKGQSGNQKGRPKGSGQIAELRQAIADRLPSIVEKLIESALAGDTQASRLLIERCIPALRPTDAPTGFDLPQGNSMLRANAIFAQMASGSLSIADGVMMVNALQNTAKLEEIALLAERIEALEHSSA
jgi:hypothetical protein